MMGWIDVPGVDGLTSDMYQWKNVSDHSAGRLFVNANASDETAFDPCHTHSCTDEGIFGVPNPAVNISGTPTMSGFVQNGLSHYHSAETVISMWPPERVPIITTLAKEFAFFDRFFCSFPGPTYPNREFVHSGTSHGMIDNAVPKDGFPQPTIFRQFNETMGPDSWKMYYEGHGGLAWAIFMADIRNSPSNLVRTPVCVMVVCVMVVCDGPLMVVCDGCVCVCVCVCVCDGCVCVCDGTVAGLV